MTDDLNEDGKLFESLVRENAPDVTIRQRGQRSVDLLNTIYQIIVVAANIGGAAGLYLACRGFLKRRPTYAIELAYVDENGQPHGALYRAANLAEVEKLLSMHAPNWTEGVQVTLRKPEP